MYHLTPASITLFVLQILASIASFGFVVVGPYFKSYNKDFRNEGLQNYSQYTTTHLGKWGEYKVPEMYVPVIFIPLAIFFPFLGMFLIRNCLRKNLSSMGKIVLLTVTVALYIINGLSIHFGARNISLSVKDTLHIGWLVAAGLNWLAVIFIILNIISIRCCEIPANKRKQMGLDSDNSSSSSNLSGSLSGSMSSSQGSLSKSGSKSKSKTGSKLGSKSSLSNRPDSSKLGFADTSL